MDFINYPVIPAPEFMKIVIPTHFSSGWIRQVKTNFFNFTLDFYQIFLWNIIYIFPNRRTKLYSIFHLLESQFFPKFIGRNILAWLLKGFFCIFNVNMIFNSLKQLKFLNRDQSRYFLTTSCQNNRFLTVSNGINNISKIFSGISSCHSLIHNTPPCVLCVHIVHHEISVINEKNKL